MVLPVPDHPRHLGSLPSKTRVGGSWSHGVMSTTSNGQPPSSAADAPATDAVFNIREVPIHLGLGATARPLLDFGWTPEQMAAYGASTAGDGAEGRLVLMDTQSQ